MSSRLGVSKASIVRDRLPLHLWWQNALAPFSETIKISCNADQAHQFKGQMTVLDYEYYKGPLSGIVSQIQSDPDEAFFVTACDLIYIRPQDIDTIFRQRKKDFDGTAMTDTTGQVFPLFTILEPSIFPVLEKEFREGKRSLLKVLSDTSINIIPSDADFRGINTPRELNEYLQNHSNL
ncbi:MAG: NTP transferase domain-containing protein [Saprospiraceae bacterium]|nr:NTP transferase domain-containing protein [Saprospiraceae bacterium]